MLSLSRLISLRFASSLSFVVGSEFTRPRSRRSLASALGRALLVSRPRTCFTPVAKVVVLAKEPLSRPSRRDAQRRSVRRSAETSVSDVCASSVSELVRRLSVFDGFDRGGGEKSGGRWLERNRGRSEWRLHYTILTVLTTPFPPSGVSCPWAASCRTLASQTPLRSRA